MNPAPKDVEQALSLPCQRLELGLSAELGLSGELGLFEELGRSDVARASRRAASASGPTLAPTETPLRPPLKRPGNPASEQPSRAPNLPQPVWAHSGHSAKVCQKTDNSGTFLPTPNPPASKKVFENKDTRE